MGGQIITSNKRALVSSGTEDEIAPIFQFVFRVRPHAALGVTLGTNTKYA